MDKYILYGYQFAFFAWTEPIVNNNTKLDRFYLTTLASLCKQNLLVWFDPKFKVKQDQGGFVYKVRPVSSSKTLFFFNLACNSENVLKLHPVYIYIYIHICVCGITVSHWRLCNSCISNFKYHHTLIQNLQAHLLYKVYSDTRKNGKHATWLYVKVKHGPIRPVIFNVELALLTEVLNKRDVGLLGVKLSYTRISNYWAQYW